MDIFETPDVYASGYTGRTVDPTGEGVPSDWTPIDTNTTPGMWVDFAGQSGTYATDLNGDGVLLNSPGEVVVFYDNTEDMAVTYAAKSDSVSQVGVVTGVTGGVDGIVVGVSHGSNGHTYVSGGAGQPGFSIYTQATNNINGLSTGWSGNYQVGTYHGSVSLTGDWGSGTGSYGTNGSSVTYGFDVTKAINSLKAWIDSLIN